MNTKTVNNISDKNVHSDVSEKYMKIIIIPCHGSGG
jgi:hypothetical protein